MLSIKNDIEMLKEELSSEEKFFEKAVVTEKFVKKYKNVMIGSLVAVVALVGGNIAYEANKQSKITSANEQVALLNENPDNTQAQENLKSLSPNLYDVWKLSKAVADKDIASLKELESSKTSLVGDIAAYELSQNSKDISALDSYASKQDAIYKDLATLQSAIVLMNKGDIDSAHQKLSNISIGSSLGKISQALKHYGVK